MADKPLQKLLTCHWQRYEFVWLWSPVRRDVPTHKWKNGVSFQIQVQVWIVVVYSIAISQPKKMKRITANPSENTAAIMTLHPPSHTAHKYYMCPCVSKGSYMYMYLTSCMYPHLVSLPHLASPNSCSLSQYLVLHRHICYQVCSGIFHSFDDTVEITEGHEMVWTWRTPTEEPCPL